MSKYFDLLKVTFSEWTADDVPRLASSIAFYTALSLAPLLLVFLALLSIFLGDEAARGQIVSQFSSELGTDNAQFIQSIIQDSNEEGQGIFSTIISVVMLVVGATGVFAQLQSALNEIWDIEVEGGIWFMIQKRLLSFGIVMTLAFLLLVSLILNGVIASLDNGISNILPGFQWLAHIITTIISFGVSTVLFAIIYKYMPDAEIKWRDVWVGSIVTAILFTVGRFALSLYIGNFGVASSYGAAGSFLVVLIWVYYSAQIVMFGAEFTQVYARRYGSRIVPEQGAKFNLQARLKANSITNEDVEDFIENETRHQSEEEIADGIKEDVKKKEAAASIASNPAKVREKALAKKETIPEAPRPTLAAQMATSDTDKVYVEQRQPTTNVLINTVIAIGSVALGWFIGQRNR